MLDIFWRGKFKNVLLTWLLLISIIPAIISFIIYSYFANISITHNAASHLEILATQKELYINDWFKQKLFFIRYLAQDPRLREDNLEEIQRFLEETFPHNSDYQTIAYIDSNGFAKAGTAGIGVDVRDRLYFQEGAKGKEYISDVLIGRDYGQPIVIFSAPIMDKGSFRGLVVGAVPLTAISRIIECSNLADTGETYLVNREGLMLTESRFTKELIQQGLVKTKTSMELKIDMEAVKEGLKGKKGFGQFTDYRGKKVFAYYTWLPERQWVLIAKQDRNEALNMGGKGAFELAVGAGGLIVLIFISIGTFLASKVSDTVATVAQAAEEIAAGKLDKVITVDSAREIRDLAESFNKMSLSLTKSYENLNATNEELGAMNEELLAVNDELISTNQALEEVSMTDQLTGLYNRHYLVDRAIRELERAKEGKYPVAVIVLDIDHFKNINDTFGHKAGDQVLQQLAGILRDFTRPGDVVARYGGEEFLVMLPDTPLETGLVVAERLRQKVVDNIFATSQGGINTTISLGISGFDGKSNLTPEELMDKLFITADLYLYRAKNKGRNQVAGEA